MTSYFYLVFHFFYFIFSAPLHLVYVFQFLHLFCCSLLKPLSSVVKKLLWGEEPRWRRSRTGRTLSLPQIHQRAFKRRVNSTKQLLNAGRGHQAPRKATQLFERRQEKIYKTKKETKEGGTEFHPRKGVLKKEKFPNTRKPSHCRICAELWKHRGQHKREKKNKQTIKNRGL